MGHTYALPVDNLYIGFRTSVAPAMFSDNTWVLISVGCYRSEDRQVLPGADLHVWVWKAGCAIGVECGLA